MANRLRAVLIVTGGLAFLSVLLAYSADAPAGSVGKKIEGFTLTAPLDKTKVSLADFKDKQAVVVVFVGTECPLNNLYLSRLAELHKEFADKGVAFVAVNANSQDSPERVAEHARKHAIPFPVLKDVGNKVADSFAAQRTPEVFLLDAKATVRYQGRIDDQYGIGFQRPKPTRRDLAEAIDELLAGKDVSKPTLPVQGCVIGRLPQPKADGKVTFTQHVAPILQKHCQECHRAGQIGPMALMTYDDASAWSETIREVVAERRMPPWFADPRHGKFTNDRRLSDAERETLLAWIEQGCAQGEAKYLTPPRQFSDGWRIDKPDLILEMPDEFDVPAKMPRNGIPYKHFTLDPGFKEDRWVVQAEARPGSPGVVHHILTFVLPLGKKFNKDDPSNPVLCGTAPGDSPMMMRPGMAKRIPAGSKLVLQMHYTPNGTAQKDRSRIGLVFAKENPVQEVHTMPVFNAFFRIPPGAENHTVVSSFTFEKDGHILGMMPHMHVRGKDFLYEAIYPDGKRETLLSVPQFSFLWQSSYRLEKPVAMPKGSVLRCTAHFDNSAKNPSNPDPTKAVFWGDQTWQEMMIGWTEYTYDLPMKR
ncbi:MAG: redoxin domain-containing protein [Gemmataceae bacterium]|nr:redoxin domain-containing protein [Gemmataceae bacterium]